MVKPSASLGNKGEECYFIEKKEEVGRGCFEGKSIKRNQGCKIVMVSHWLSCCSFSLATLLLGKEKIFLPPSEVVKKLLPAQECKVSCKGWYVCESSPLQGSLTPF